ncbi:PREDICTED: DNA dC-_dU-editing enzyme APOBEC-3C, partial [Ceratotherium simum simum]|uniref:DNA dC->dU-editing enzyme APOBEC-3C n=1 Tax=Ceratotherium simum simum TaxID=73337 RepID=A0ABM0IAT1_CERSS
VTGPCCPCPSPRPHPSLPAGKGSRECSGPTRVQGLCSADASGNSSSEDSPSVFTFLSFAPRNPMKWLDPQTFYFNFDNLQYAYGRYHCYLCFQVEREVNGSLVHVDMGVFVNQSADDNCHVELCFLSWFYAWLSPDERYHVTWFMSWSPCSQCAQQVAEFLKKHSNVNLSIFAARLYHFKDPEIQQGLRTLKRTGVQVAIMYFSDFLYCWNNFVRHGGMRFIPWKGINKNYWILVTTLEEILW